MILFSLGPWVSENTLCFDFADVTHLMQDVDRDVIRQLEEACVVVRRVDPRASAKGQRLQRMSARYESGYWQIKMAIWKLVEYEKVSRL